jgi:hypothetical protein
MASPHNADSWTEQWVCNATPSRRRAAAEPLAVVSDALVVAAGGEFAAADVDAPAAPPCAWLPQPAATNARAMNQVRHPGGMDARRRRSSRTLLYTACTATCVCDDPDHVRDKCHDQNCSNGARYGHAYEALIFRRKVLPHSDTRVTCQPHDRRDSEEDAGTDRNALHGHRSLWTTSNARPTPWRKNCQSPRGSSSCSSLYQRLVPPRAAYHASAEPKPYFFSAIVDAISR